MAKKKITRKRKSIGQQKAARRKKVAPRGKSARGKTKPARRPTRRRSTAPREISSGSERSSLGSGILGVAPRPNRRGLGEEAGGQSGDLQGLSRAEGSNSESVEELLEEGQAFEAEAIGGVENAPDPDQDEVHTHERPEDELGPEDEKD